MPRNRIQPVLEESRLPAQPAQPTNNQGFVCVNVCSFACSNPQQLSWMQWLYMKAMEEAQAVCKPSLPERDLLGIWN